MLHTLLGRIRAIFNCDTIAIYTMSEDGKELIACAAHGLEEDVKTKIRIPIHQGIVGSILSNKGKPLFIEDLSQVEIVSPALRDRNIRSLLGNILKTDEK